jgi:DNA-binding response OmpR family regulator
MKLLLVEDDLFFQKFYASKLTEAGYEMDVASDGNEGLVKLVTFRPDIMLLDMIMPQKDGFEVLEEMKKNATLSKVPVIVFSTLGDEQDVKKAMELGAVDYVNKSFHDLESLKQKINAHIAG